MTAGFWEQVSIIIPYYNEETQFEFLLSDLRPVEKMAEIITLSEGSRARSLNAGAKISERHFLWFLHADSRVTMENLIKLAESGQAFPEALHYFDLSFDRDGSFMTPLNAWGANMRSRLFGAPYGDQGLFVAKDQFVACKGYPEDVSYGEDLLFVLRAQQAGIQLHRIVSRLLTSARKYRQHGWLRLTILYQWRWITMVWREKQRFAGEKI